MATININKATKEQLMTIRDIGATRATAIINERQNQFPLTLEKFKLIPGISAHIWDPLVSSGRITFEIRAEEGEEFLKKMFEKFKTENVILKQADVTKIMEIKKMETDFDTQVENLQTELGILVKQNEELTTKLQERENYIDSVAKQIEAQESKNNRPIKSHVWIQPVLTCKHDWEWIRLLQILWSIALKLQIGKDDDKKESKYQKYID